MSWGCIFDFEQFFSCCPVKSGIFLSIGSSARLKGVAPLRLSLAVELMWLASRFISSWVYLYMLLPLRLHSGCIHVFSIRAF